MSYLAALKKLLDGGGYEVPKVPQAPANTDSEPSGTSGTPPTGASENFVTPTQPGESHPFGTSGTPLSGTSEVFTEPANQETDDDGNTTVDLLGVAERHELTLNELLDAAGPDRAELEQNEELADVFADAVKTRLLREQGEIPEQYTENAICPQCGPVWVFPGIEKFQMLACPWCQNCQKGLPIPRPEPVRCGECRHFHPDPIGAGGIGDCAVDIELRPGEIPMYPNAKRQCGRWLPNFRPADAGRGSTLALKPEPGH